MNQRNCHARSKQKRKALRLKNMFAAIYKRKLDRMKPEPPKGKPYQGKASLIAIPYHELFPTGEYSLYFNGSNHGRNLNQRQKRKKLRQQPHGK